MASLSGTGIDLTGSLKNELIEHLSNDQDILAVVGSVDQITGMQVITNPTYPLIRYGVPITDGFAATCWEGSAIRTTLHTFAETSAGRGAGEDQVAVLNALLVESVKKFQPKTLRIIENLWVSSRVIPDSMEADRWHGIVEHSITVVKP